LDEFTSAKVMSIKNLSPEDEIGWFSRERALALTLYVSTAIALFLCYLIVRPFLSELAWALALAVIAHPLHDWIARRISYPNAAAFLTVLIVAVTIVAPALFVTERLVREAAENVEIIKAGATIEQWRNAIDHNPRLATVTNWLKEYIDLNNEISQITAKFTDRLSSLLIRSVWAVVELLIILFLLFYSFRDRRKLLQTVRSLVPLSNKETDEVFSRVADTIYATIYGTLMVAMVQGALGGLMFWWLGLPSPLLWGIIMGLLAIVPFLGTFVVWVPVAIFFALEGNWGKAIVLTVWGGVVIALIDNLLYPILVGKRLRLSTPTVFFAVLGGLSLFGAAGVILGPVIIVITIALVDVWRRRTRNGRAADVNFES
jgi:predicted PurR-regulated permease PerM